MVVVQDKVCSGAGLMGRLFLVQASTRTVPQSVSPQKLIHNCRCACWVSTVINLSGISMSNAIMVQYNWKLLCTESKWQVPRSVWEDVTDQQKRWCASLPHPDMPSTQSLFVASGEPCAEYLSVGVCSV